MPARPVSTVPPALLLCLACCVSGLAQREANTTLDFPLELPTGAYELVDAYTFDSPLALAHPPARANQLFVAERAGRIRVISDLQQGTIEADPFLDISSRVTTNGENGLLGLAFHPDYAANRQFFVFYCSFREGGERVNRLSRFLRSEEDPFSADPDSETILIDQLDQASNHNGGDIHFGPDGYLYVALGDEGGGNDSFDNSQRVDRDFFSGILRLDVDRLPENIEPTSHPSVPLYEGQAAYRIPADNPLVSRWRDEGADPDSSLRLEFHAIGLRNPWRIAFDPVTGELWAGDVGQGLREEIDIIESGGNYGWAFREGSIDGPKEQSPPVGFETIIGPVSEYGRDHGVSVTGGLVYRGSRLPELEGSYIFGDFGSGRIWALFEEPGNSGYRREEIASYPGHFEYGVDPSNGDLLVAGSSGAIRRLVRGEGSADPGFPSTLSEAGIFRDLAALRPESGIYPYELNHPFWSDHATKKRWVSIPQGNQIAFARDEPWGFPAGGIWIKHFELERERGNPESRFKVETRVFVKTRQSAYGLTYVWNEAGTDAQLAPEEGMAIDYQITVDGQPQTQTWPVPSRSDCLACHTAAAGYVLGFNTRQLNRVATIQGQEQNVLDYLKSLEILDTVPPEPRALPRHHALDDDSATLERRARSYLAVNCAPCHQPGGGAPNTWDGRAHLSIEATGLVGGMPADNGGDPELRLVKRGSPQQSALLRRVAASNGFARMPPLASNELDQGAIDLLTDWLSLQAPAPQSFDQWQAEFFEDPAAAIAAATADPDSDGNSNALEFLNRTDPRDPADRWTVRAQRQPASIQVRFPMSPQRRYEVESSSDLIEWEASPAAGNPPRSDNLEPSEAVLDHPSEAGEGPVFLRVRVSDEP